MSAPQEHRNSKKGRKGGSILEDVFEIPSETGSFESACLVVVVGGVSKVDWLLDLTTSPTTAPTMQDTATTSSNGQYLFQKLRCDSVSTFTSALSPILNGGGETESQWQPEAQNHRLLSLRLDNF